ncbi:MAG: hypothetical protein HQ538_06915 [Parcubacteria group bacterium]|nr:hypothetical protein [Parcubacteria group bacterium]
MLGYIVFVLIWIICGTLSYGLAYGYFQGKWSWAEFECIDPGITKRLRQKDRKFALLMFLLGPIAAIVGLFCSEFGKYGLRFKDKKEKN